MKNLRTVVAEDNDISRRAVIALLEHVPGVSIVGEAIDGEEALKYVAEVDPDLLILDVQMPKSNGWQVLHQLQKQKALVKIIIFSTFGTSSLAKVLEGYGVVAHIHKADHKALVNSVRELVKME